MPLPSPKVLYAQAISVSPTVRPCPTPRACGESYAQVITLPAFDNSYDRESGLGSVLIGNFHKKKIKNKDWHYDDVLVGNEVTGEVFLLLNDGKGTVAYKESLWQHFYTQVDANDMVRADMNG